MKLQSTSQANSASSGDYSRWYQVSRQIGLSVGTGGALIAGVVVMVAATPAAALPPRDGIPISQALPTPLPPLPDNSGAVMGAGEQYLVLVDGNSELLLQQIRQIEPGAFINYVGGQSVIQAGRFNSYQNAQLRANELANFGIGAEVQATDFAGAPIAVTPSSEYDLSYPIPNQASASVGQATSSTAIAAAPSTIEFGQAAPFQTTTPSSAAAFPPASSLPAPPQTNATPPSLNAPVITNESLPSGYYVVIPGSNTELQSLASRVIALGAPSSLVSTRTAPRGPHVAVGPYDDHDIAQEWSNYLRDSGIPSARVHFE